jgi:hypothetical protein
MIIATIREPVIAAPSAVPPLAAEVDARTRELLRGAAGTNAVAGYGTGVRLECLLIPLIFGLGAPLVALVGTNIGAGQKQEHCASCCRRRHRLCDQRDAQADRGDLPTQLCSRPPSRAPRKAERFFLRSPNRSQAIGQRHANR